MYLKLKLVIELISREKILRKYCKIFDKDITIVRELTKDMNTMEIYQIVKKEVIKNGEQKKAKQEKIKKRKTGGNKLFG